LAPSEQLPDVPLTLMQTRYIHGSTYCLPIFLDATQSN
jgi:hypothetical protein